MWTLKVLSPASWPVLQLLDDVRLAGQRQERRQPVVVLDDLVGDRAGRDLARASGPASGRGRRPPSWCSSRCGTGSSPPSGQVFMCGPLSVLYMTIVSSAMPSSSSWSSSWPTCLSWSIIVSWYGDCHAPGLAEALRLGVRAEVHVGGVDPARRTACRPSCWRSDEVARRASTNSSSHGLHPLLGQRAGVLDPLLADPAPARVLGGVVLVGRPAVQHAARPEPLPEVRELLAVG